jgi:3-oxoacyl-[acyl-carrier protein] reductase
LSAVLLVEALREKLAAAQGRVVLMSSVAALRGSGGGAYGAVKAALHAYAFDLVAERAAQTLVGREGQPAEIASLIAWLLGPDGGWLTGQILSPNGGSVLGR